MGLAAQHLLQEQQFGSMVSLAWAALLIALGCCCGAPSMHLSAVPSPPLPLLMCAALLWPCSQIEYSQACNYFAEHAANPQALEAMLMKLQARG